MAVASGAAANSATIDDGAGGLGGHGMQVSGDIAVTPGQCLYLYVGGNGQAGVFDETSGAGGYNGGGHGGGDGDVQNYAGGGGGETDLRLHPTSTTSNNDCSEFGAAQPHGPGRGAGRLRPRGRRWRWRRERLKRFHHASDAAIPVTPDGGNGGSQPGDASPPSAGTAGGPAGTGGGGGGAGTNASGGTAGAGVNGGADGQAGATAASATCGGTGGLRRQ